MQDDADAPEHAATLFESVMPSLPPPSGLLLEPCRTQGVVTWTIRVEGGAYYRLKVAADLGASARLRRGAALLGPLTARGVPVPSSVALRDLLPVHEGPTSRRGPPPASALGVAGGGGGLEGWGDDASSDPPPASGPDAAAPDAAEGVSSARGARGRRVEPADVVVAIETRLGTSDGLAVWQLLGTALRSAVAEEAAHGLWLLHRVAWAEVAPWGGLAGTASRPWRDVVLGRVGRLLDRMRDASILPAGLIPRLEARLREGAARLPADVDRRLCHGAFGIDAVAVQRRVYAGMRDFEHAAAGDPWTDVASFVDTVGDAAPSVTDRFVRTYAGHVAPPADLTSRIDLYSGLHLLRAVRQMADRLGDEVAPALAELVEAWVDRPARAWR